MAPALQGLVILLIAALGTVRAAEPTVRTVLTLPETTVDGVVRIQVEVLNPDATERRIGRERRILLEGPDGVRFQAEFATPTEAVEVVVPAKRSVVLEDRPLAEVRAAIDRELQRRGAAVEDRRFLLIAEIDGIRSEPLAIIDQRTP